MRNFDGSATHDAGAAKMTDEAEVHVWVRRRWNDRKIGKVRLADLSGFHWSQYGSGHKFLFGGIAPQPFLHAFMLCTKIIEGRIGHTCRHGPPPHTIKVCMTRKDNRRGFAFLESLADPRQSIRSVRRKHKKRIARRLESSKA
jgi:hypothetical protein